MGSIPVGSTKKKRPHGLFFLVPRTGIPFPRDLSRRVRKFSAKPKTWRAKYKFLRQILSRLFLSQSKRPFPSGRVSPSGLIYILYRPCGLFFGAPDGNSLYILLPHWNDSLEIFCTSNLLSSKNSFPSVFRGVCNFILYVLNCLRCYLAIALWYPPIVYLATGRSSSIVHNRSLFVCLIGLAFFEPRDYRGVFVSQ